MSDVTADEVIGAVAHAYGLDAELVRHGGPEPVDAYERRLRLQAKMVAVHLLKTHRGDAGRAVCVALGMPINSNSYDFVKTSGGLIPPYLLFDKPLQARVGIAEQIIDDIHERRIDAKMRQAGRALQGVAA